MAIQTSSQGTLPAVDLNFLQYSEFNMRVGETAPYTIGISGKLRPYGVVNGVKYYDKEKKPMNIQNLDAYIQSIDPARQAEAIQAMGAVQQGLGVLASIYFGVDFVGVV